MIKAVLFDIDNTLYSYDNAHSIAWEALCAYAQDNLGMERQAFTYNHQAAAELAKARLGVPCAAVHDRTLRYQLLLEQSGLPLGHALPMSELYWDTLIRSAAPFPGLSACLADLVAAGFTLGIGTDMTIDYQLKKLSSLGLLSFFRFIVSSEEVNAEKPDERLFLTCAAKAGAAPHECLFIGDSLQKDVLGAKSTGMETIWFGASAEQAAAHPEIAVISDYTGLAARLCGGSLPMRKGVSTG